MLRENFLLCDWVKTLAKFCKKFGERLTKSSDHTAYRRKCHRSRSNLESTDTRPFPENVNAHVRFEKSMSSDQKSSRTFSSTRLRTTFRSRLKKNWPPKSNAVSIELHYLRGTPAMRGASVSFAGPVEICGQTCRLVEPSHVSKKV